MITATDLPNLTIGADPELFVRKGRHFVSGHLFECGTKSAPLPTPHGWIQNDGLALEMNIIPARSADEFVRNCQLALGDLQHFLKSRDEQAELVIRPSVFFGVSKLKVLPPYVYDLGCTPDYNAYHKNGTAPVAKPDFRMPFRTGAGHVHVGWGEGLPTNGGLLARSKLVEYLDLYLGCASLVWDSDTRRRRMYGQAGSFRPKEYGLEYRVLSNQWLSDQKLMREVYERTVLACQAYTERRASPTMLREAKQVIDAGNVHFYREHPALAKEIGL